MNMKLRKYIKEVVRKEIINLLSEKTAADNFYTLDDLVNLIISDSKKNLIQNYYQFSENGLNIKIKVCFDRKEYCGWYDDWNHMLIIYVETNPKFYNIKNILSHELIHKIDDEREQKNRTDFLKKNGVGSYKPIIGRNFFPSWNGNGTVEADCPISEDVNEILYRLWSRTERNAYVAQSYLGMDFCREYLKFLEDTIDKIEQSNVKDNFDCWIELHKLLYYHNEINALRPDSYTNGYGKQTTFETYAASNRCKKYFIRKSRYLLNAFSKKLLKNCMNNTYLKKVGSEHFEYA